MLGLVGVIAGALSAATATAIPVAARESLFVKVAKDQLPIPTLHTKDGPRNVPAISGSMVEAAKAAYQAQGNEAGRSNANRANGGSLAVSPSTLGCGKRNTDGDVRVNQDCTYRRQAEEIIKFNPADPSNLIAGQNDSRIGYNHCGFDYSFNNGQTWGDGLPPFWQHTNFPAAEEPTPTDPNRHTVGGGPGTGHTQDAASDPIIAADTQGRSFFGCVVFDVLSNANGLIVTQSPAGAGGSFYDNVPDHVYNFDQQGNLTSVTGGRRFIVAEDNNGAVLHDKPFLTADLYPNSPNRDNLYVTWTVFKFDPRCVAGGTQCESPIYGSMSTDHGLTWSTPEEISGTSDTLCFFGNALDPTANPNSCNFDQGADPIVLPNGQLEVVFNNGNTQGPNNTIGVNGQQLGVHCMPSGSSPAGTAQLNCAAPAKVGNDVVVGEPLCNFGRGPEECIPGAYIRTNDFPRIAVNRGNGDLYATWQDYRTGEFDIHLSQSTDGGLTWTEASAPVNPDQGKDHYFPAIDVVPSGAMHDDRAAGTSGQRGDRQNNDDHVAISYFRTVRVPNEGTTPPQCAGFPTGVTCFAPGQPGVQAENSDYVLSGGMGLDTPYAAERVSPEFPPPDGNQAGFNGDYSGLTVVGEIAHPIWSDTRNMVPDQFQAQPPGQGVVHDEDVFTTARAVPNGHGEQDGS